MTAGELDRTEVVVATDRGLRLLATGTMGPLCVGIVLAGLAALRSGDPGAPLGRTGWTPYVAWGWTVSLVVLVVMAVTLWALWSTEVRFTPWAVSSRVLGRRRETGVQDLRLVTLRGPVNRSATGPRPAAVVLVDREGRTVAALRPTETNFRAALDVVAGWVERRPDLVQDAATALVLSGLPTAEH